MTNEFKIFLNCLKDNIHSQGRIIGSPLISIAYNQQVEGFFYKSVSSANKQILTRNYSYQYLKNRSVYELLKNLNNNGIETYILKGMAVSRFYPKNIHRISTDTDVLINKRDINKITKILKMRGLDVYQMREEEHHLSASHVRTGKIEFHHRLYDEIFDELWFGNEDYIEEEYETFSFGDLEFKTLGINDGFIFTFLHFVKHYILDYVTMRWVLDLLFYVQKNSERLDWERICSVCEKLGYKTLLETVFGVGVKYLGFQKDLFCDFSCDDEKIDALVTDIEFCSVKENRKKLKGFFHLLNNEAQKKGDYVKYIKKYNKMDKFHVVFADRSHLQRQYKVLYKHPYLLPFVWIYRVFKLTYSLLFRGRKISEYGKVIPDNNEELQSRLSLMKKLDII